MACFKGKEYKPTFSSHEREDLTELREIDRPNITNEAGGGVGISRPKNGADSGDSQPEKSYSSFTRTGPKKWQQQFKACGGTRPKAVLCEC